MAVLKYKNAEGEYVALNNYSVSPVTIEQATGTNIDTVMSQNAVTQALEKKLTTEDLINAPIVEEADYIFGLKDNELIRILPSDISGGGSLTGDVGDILFYDRTKSSKVIVPYSEWNASQSSYPSSRYTPIGVVAIPSSHDVYGTGQSGVMSIVPMSYSTPNVGGESEQSIYWGQYEVDTTLTDYTQVIYSSSASATSFSSYTTLGSTCYLPSDKFSGSECGTDSSAHYYGTTSYYLPSPYASDGGFNSYYSQGETSNVLSDFDGVSNTKVLLELATTQSDWKTASTITNNSGSGYSPAACCCWRYHTDGTAQGDWYLPAMGELGYMMVRYSTLNTTINALNSAYSVGVALASSSTYWSSSEASSTDAVYVGTGSGYVYYFNKFSYYYVRAFLRV